MTNLINIEIKKSTNILRALNHPLRQQIIQDIMVAHNKTSVTDLYVRLRIDQSVASQHLGILRRAKVVVAKRSGKHIYYSVDNNEIMRVGSLCKLINN